VPGFFGPVDNLSRRDIEALARSIQPNTQKIENTRLRLPELWWGNLSSLQKGARRGDAVHALGCCERLYRHDPAKLRRRLCVITLEDVSLGDLRTVAMVMHYGASAAREASEADLGVCLALTEQMANAVKDRITSELVGAAIDSPRRRDHVLDIATTRASDCVRLYKDENADPRDRCVVGLALSGSLSVENRRIGQRDRHALIDAVRGMEVPDAISLIVECALKFGGELAALAVTIPILYGRMTREAITVKCSPLPEAPLIADLLAPAYDRHTRVGLRALSTYRLRWKPLAKFLRQNVADPRAAIKTLAFRAEGSALDQEVSCEFGDEIYAANERAQADVLAMEHAALPQGKRLFLDGLPVLNWYRREAAAAELRALGSS
jgi:hypothetical protein